MSEDGRMTSTQATEQRQNREQNQERRKCNDLPLDIKTNQFPKSNQRMSHQSDSSACFNGTRVSQLSAPGDVMDGSRIHPMRIEADLVE